MGTLGDRNYTSTFKGLQSTAITSGVVLVLGFTLHEVLMRLRRYPEEDKRRARGEPVPDRGVEGYAMGYLFRARSYVPYNPSPQPDPRPLGWVWNTSFKLNEKFYETHVGPDATVYLRFLRGSFYWTVLIAVTVFPVLLGINFTFSDPTVSTNSLARAALTSLNTSPRGRGLLWVHVVMMWFLVFSWYATLAWIGYGAVRIRRNTLRAILREEANQQDVQPKDEKAVVAPVLREPRPLNPRDERPVGWRWRTVLVRNIPLGMRSESALREYFSQKLRSGTPSPEDKTHFSPSSNTHAFESPDPSASSGPVALRSESPAPIISEIVLVRREAELNELFNKYRAAQNELEEAHVELVERVMAFIKTTIAAEGRRARGERDRASWWTKVRSSIKMFRTKAEVLSEEAQRLAREGDARLVEALRCYLPGGSAPVDKSGEPKLLWEVMHELRMESPMIFDRFQPLFKLKKFRGQAVPSIDYHLAKLNLLATLIEDKRANPEQFEMASSAFVTFERAADARRVRKRFKWREGFKIVHRRVLENKVELAPEVRDLDWNRLVLVSLSSDIIRGFVLQVLIWAATIFWVIPLSFLVGLLSLNSIERYIPRLADFLSNNSITQTLFNSLLPSGIVALLGMLVPTLIGIITRNGQALITVTALHSVVQSRYWKWLVVNIILVFCIGVSAFNAVLDAIKTPGSLLPVIADAFPKGATFFVSWVLLVVGLHHGNELAMLIVPWMNHNTIRKLKAPRRREFEAQPRSFNYAYWVPNHLLVLAVTAIFAVLNPLVVAFNTFYQFFVLITFKNQLAHVYWRRWYENNGRLIFTRIFRYSLDSFVLAQIVIIAYLFVGRYDRYGAACIPLPIVTFIIKIIGTRWFNALMDEIDEAEIDLVCGEDNSMTADMSVPLTVQDQSMHKLKPLEAALAVKSFAFRTLPALVLRPKAKLPAVDSPHKDSTHFRPRIGTASTTARPARSRTNSSRPRVKSSASLDDGRPMLAMSTFGENDYKLGPLASKKASAHQDFDLKAFSKGQEPHHDPTVGRDAHPMPIVVRYPPVVRDDRPVTNVRYHNPAMVAELARSLWLPRDPLVPVDLGDTIDYYGRALVSSEGGSGLIGTWDDSLTDLKDAIEESCTVEMDPKLTDAPPVSSDQQSRRTSMSLRLERTGALPSGNERIRVAGDVAANIEAEEGVRVVAADGDRASTTGSQAVDRSDRSPSLTATPRAPGTAPIDSLSLGRRASAVSSMQTGLSSSPAVVAPAIPSPSAQSNLEAASTSSTTGAYFPPNVTAGQGPDLASRRTSLRSRRSYSEDLGTADHTSLTIDPANVNLSAPTSPGIPGSSQVSPAATTSITNSHLSPTVSRTTRRGRSSSAARSMHSSLVIAEDDEGERVPTISQAQALRIELIEEERRTHELHASKESARKQKEVEDHKRSGFLSRFVLGDVREEGKDEA